MKEKKVSIGARIPESIFNAIVELQEVKNIQRTDAITLLLSRGVNSNSDTNLMSSPVHTAKKMAEELTNSKQAAKEWKEKYMELAAQSGVDSHPFLQTLNTEGIEFTFPDKKIRVQSLKQLFDFLNNRI